MRLRDIVIWFLKAEIIEQQSYVIVKALAWSGSMFKGSDYAWQNSVQQRRKMEKYNYRVAIDKQARDKSWACEHAAPQLDVCRPRQFYFEVLAR